MKQLKSGTKVVVVRETWLERRLKKGMVLVVIKHCPDHTGWMSDFADGTSSAKCGTLETTFGKLPDGMFKSLGNFRRK